MLMFWNILWLTLMVVGVIYTHGWQQIVFAICVGVQLTSTYTAINAQLRR